MDVREKGIAEYGQSQVEDLWAEHQAEDRLTNIHVSTMCHELADLLENWYPHVIGDAYPHIDRPVRPQTQHIVRSITIHPRPGRIAYRRHSRFLCSSV